MKRWTNGFAIVLVFGSCAVASAQTTAASTSTDAGQDRTTPASPPAATAPAHQGRVGRFKERINLTAIPAGVVFVRRGDTASQPRFDSYVPGGAVAVKLTDRMDVEGEVAWAIGRTQELKFEGEDLGRFKTPTLFGYNGNVIVNLLASDRMIVPYAVGGIGGVRMSKREELGITASENFLTGDVGAGAKVMWGSIGVRGDYRFVALRTRGDDASFVGDKSRYGHRVYAGVIVAPGRHRSGS